MTHTITGTFDTLVTLGSALYDPTTITSSGRLNAGLQVSQAGLIVTNAGGIGSGTANVGVDIIAGGGVTNQSGGSIRGTYFGILGENAGVTVVNAGVIQAFAIGVNLASGAITNQSGGKITGGVAPITGGVLTVVNGGTLEGPLGYGVRISGGSVSNQSGGSIHGTYGGILAENASVTVVNAGNVLANVPATFNSFSAVRYIGIDLRAGGSVTNQSGGSISGRVAIKSSGALTVENAGTIAGMGAYGPAGHYVLYGPGVAVQFPAGFANRLVVDPNAVFAGLVNGGNTIGATSLSTMELAGTMAGTLAGIGTQFVDFAQTTIDAGASWTLTGANGFAAGSTLTNAGTLTIRDTTLSDAGLVINNGSIQIDPSAVTFDSLTGTGTIAIDSGGTLDTIGSVSAGETVVFSAVGGLLGVNPTAFAGRIDGFAAGDTIELTGVTDGVSAEIINANTLQIERTGHPAVDLTLDPSIDYAGNNYAVSADGAVTEAPCFLHGTLIRTERGEVAVQDLAVGDRVLTLSGALRSIIWIGTGQVAISPGRRCAATPIIVRKGALADNVQHHDLHITKGHELFIDGVLVPAESLINHRSIRWDDHRRTVSFYHVELATHDVLIANGAAVESYRDDGNRWLFQNANGGWDKTPKPPCAPVLTGGPIVDAIWRQLLNRAGPRPSVTLTGEPDLHLLVDGARLEPTIRKDNIYVFSLPRAPVTVHMISRAAVPQELDLARDPRCLGVALRCIVVRQMSRFRIIEAGDTRLREGFHAFEGGNRLRWTDGDATLPATLTEGFDGAVELVLHLGCSTRYPTFAQAMSQEAA